MTSPGRRKVDFCENEHSAKRPCRHPPRAHGDSSHDSPDAYGGDGGNHSGLHTGGKALACHYYKFFPTQFTRCLFRNHLTSTSFVLQHLTRCHMRPTCIQCPTCKQSFDKANERDWHVKQQTCRRDTGHIRGDLDNDSLEGIDAGRLALLRSRPKRGLTEAERWYAIWDVLFPYAPRPDSPYIISPEDEILHIARRAMKMVFPYGTSSQLLDRLNWSTVSSALENQSSNQAADRPFNETASLSPDGSLISPQSGDAEPSSTTAIPSVSSQAESSNSVPDLHMETPTCSVFSLDNETAMSGITLEEQLFAPVLPWEAPYDEAPNEAHHQLLSDGFQTQMGSAEPREWYFDSVSDNVFLWGTSDYEQGFVNTARIPELADPSTATASPVPLLEIDTSTVRPLQIPPTSPGTTLQNSLEDNDDEGYLPEMILADDQNVDTGEELADGSLWYEGQDALGSGEPERIATRENIFPTCEETLTEAQKQMLTLLTEGEDVGTARNYISRDPAARREELKKITELGLRLMKQSDIRTTLLGHIIVRQDVEADIAGAVEWAEDHIKGDIKDLTYLPIVMAGVSLSPSLLKSPHKDKAASQSDFPYVTSQMCHIAREALVLLEHMRADLKAGGIDHSVDLYNWKVVFHVQVQSPIWFYHSRINNGVLSFIDCDGWEEKLQSLWEGDKTSVSNFTIATSQALKQVVRGAECLQQTFDNLFGRVEGLVGVSHNQLDNVQVAGSRACLEALQESDFCGDKNRTDLEKDGLLKHKPSCWVLGREDFERWRGDTDGQLLWIHGDPGKAKTMLLCGIIDELKTAAPKDNISFFFCQTMDARINKATTVLRGLIYMFVTQQPALISHLRVGCNGLGEGRFESPNSWVTLSEVLTSILEDPGLRRTYLVIDALDEYTEVLHLHLALVAQKSSTYSNPKWIMSSRNWPSIEKDLDTAMQEAGLSLEVKEKSVSAATTTYVQFMAGRLAKQSKCSNDTRDAVEHCLSANAHGIFLSLALVGRELATTPGWKTEKMSALFPPGLDAVYNRMLGRIYNSEDATLCKDSIFAVVSVVYRSIVLDELTALVDTLDGTSGNCEDSTALSGSFLTLREQTISFVHQPCKDSLVKQSRDDICDVGPGTPSLEAMSLQNCIYEGIASILWL